MLSSTLSQSLLLSFAALDKLYALMISGMNLWIVSGGENFQSVDFSGRQELSNKQ